MSNQRTRILLLLCRVELTEPIENTVRYGRSIAKLATTIGGGKPVIQRMGDLRRGRRTTAEETQKEPGDKYT